MKTDYEFPSFRRLPCTPGFPFTCIHLKRLLQENVLKYSLSFLIVAGPPCAKRQRKEDPFNIFVFDLTSSPEEESYEVQKTKPLLLKPVPKGTVNTHRTRSKTMTYVKNANEHKTTRNIAEPDEMKSHQQSKPTTKVPLLKKLPSVKESVSKRSGRASPTSKQKAASDRDDKVYGYNRDTIMVTPERLIKATLENSIPRSKVAQSVFQVIALICPVGIPLRF